MRVWPGAAQEATPRRSLLSLAPRPPPPANCAESRAHASVAARPRPSPCSCWRACVWAGEVSGRARPGTALLRSPETRAILPPSRSASPSLPDSCRAPDSPAAAPTKFCSAPRREGRDGVGACEGPCGECRPHHEKVWRLHCSGTRPRAPSLGGEPHPVKMKAFRRSRKCRRMFPSPRQMEARPRPEGRGGGPGSGCDLGLLSVAALPSGPRPRGSSVEQ